MESFRLWTDGFSPIIFTAVYDAEKTNPELVANNILEEQKKMSKKFKKVFIVLNFSLIEFSHDNIILIKEIKQHLTDSLVKSLVVVLPSKKKFSINLSSDNQESDVKSFNCFEEALRYINHQMENPAKAA